MRSHPIAFLILFFSTTQVDASAHDKAFTAHARLLGGGTFCTNADDFTAAGTRVIAPKLTWTFELAGLYTLPGNRVYLSTGLGLTYWRYEASLRKELLDPLRYDNARQGPGGSSFTIPLRAGVRIRRKLSVEAGWVFMRHTGRAPVANDAYTLRSGGVTIVGEASNFRTRFSNSLADLTINYYVAHRTTIHLRGGASLQSFPGVRVVESRREGTGVLLYRTEGAARLGFATVGIGYRL